jgi:hypothetical protein
MVASHTDKGLHILESFTGETWSMGVANNEEYAVNLIRHATLAQSLRTRRMTYSDRFP